MENQEQNKVQEQNKDKNQSKNKAILKEKYQAKGCQTLSLADYEALRAKRSRKKGISIPVHFKFIFSTPLLIVFCFGVLFLPYVVYLIATGPFSPPKEKPKAEDISSENSLAKQNTPDD